MAITSRQASRLCTARELQLVKASMERSIAGLTEARLRQKMTLARRLRDKYRELARRQRGEARGKRAPQGRAAAAGNANTKQKAALFHETLARFEKKLARVSAQASSATTAQARIKVRASSRARHAKKSTYARKQNKLAGAAQSKIQGHVSASGRRNQAKRDR